MTAAARTQFISTTHRASELNIPPAGSSCRTACVLYSGSAQFDITIQPEGGYFYFNQLFNLDSNNWINGIANFHDGRRRKV